MKKIEIKEFGGPEVLEIKNVDIGTPGQNEVLVKNLSIGINYIDTYHRSGLYPIPLPSGIGLEACSIIEEVGSEVKLFKVGDRVTRASMPIGTYSEKQIIPEDKLVKVPNNISDEVASCITLKGITAEYLLHRTYQVKKGDKILYHAAAGALGQIFCPWANALGAEIIGTVGSDEKIEIALALEKLGVDIMEVGFPISSPGDFESVSKKEFFLNYFLFSILLKVIGIS